MKHSLKRLAIDTATPYLYVALYEGDHKLYSVYEKGNNDHSVTLMQTVETLFKKARWSVSNLDQIIIGVGPGSYTGVRIGVVVAKMLAFSHDIELFQISSLALLASASKKQKVLTYIDARRNHAFAGVFKNNDFLEAYIPERYISLNEALQNWAYDEAIDALEPDLTVVLNSPLLKRVENKHALSPHYLRKTEAERNL